MTAEEINHLLNKISINNCQHSFRRLYEIFFPRMFEVAKFYVRINHIAEEIVADVFIKLWKNRSNINKIENLQNYFYIAVKRQSLNALRDSDSMLFYIDSVEHELIIENNDPEKALFSEEYLEYIANCVQNLPEKCRLVFKMIKEDQLSYKQAAEVVGLSVKTVEMHISNALKQLRIDVQKYKNYHQSVNIK